VGVCFVNLESNNSTRTALFKLNQSGQIKLMLDSESEVLAVILAYLILVLYLTSIIAYLADSIFRLENRF
jgi:hypothetical protein